MKKSLLLTLSITLMALGNLHAQKFLYVDSMYASSSVSRTNAIMYQANYSVLTGSPKLDTFRMDLYRPTLNTNTNKPVVIFLHTGNYLPRYAVNKQTVGARDDSATVEFCTQMARRGYVVASISYRLGWNPLAATEDARKSGIINAAYKSVQDIAAAVRFFKKSVKEGNTYGIDSTKIVIGGQGTGSYAMYAFATVDAQEDIKIAKFYDFVNNKAMVNDSVFGDRFGLKIAGSSGVYANENYKGYTSNAAMGFAIGGCMGDSGWLQASHIPLISTHCVKDFAGPYKTGMVVVPVVNYPVVEVSGGHSVMARMNRLGNNNAYAIKSRLWWDPISVKIRSMNENLEGLFPIHGVANSSGPWEWWDDSATLNAKLLAGGLSQVDITAIIANGKKSNPLMSKTRAMLYIDSIMNFTMPRVACALGLWNCAGGQYGAVSTEQIDLTGSINIRPNPASKMALVSHFAYGQTLISVTLTDMNGRELVTKIAESSEVALPLDVTPGIYLVHLNFVNGHAVKKLVVN